MVLSHARHCFYKIGEDIGASLANCKTYDRLMREDPSGLLMTLELSNLISESRNERKVNYVKAHVEKYCAPSKEPKA